MKFLRKSFQAFMHTIVGIINTVFGVTHVLQNLILVIYQRQLCNIN